MAIFAIHTTVHQGFEPVRFSPGDKLPEWAVGLVGDHCLAGKRATPVEGTVPVAGPVTEDPVKAEPADAPDFTKPKQTRQRRK